MAYTDCRQDSEFGDSISASSVRIANKLIDELKDEVCTSQALSMWQHAGFMSLSSTT